MIPLAMVEEGKTVRVSRIIGGRGLLLRLSSMGIREGEIIKVISNNKGPVLVSIRDSRFALGLGMTHKILVEEV